MIKELKNKTIGVIAGGFSEERDVSLRSGKNIFNSLVQMGYKANIVDPVSENILDTKLDIAFLALHGKYGEDGTIQSLLEHYKIPYTGSGISSSIMCMNKLLTKNILIKENLPTPPFQVLNKFSLNKPLAIPFPVVLKPIDEGSSVDVSIIHTQKNFNQISTMFFNKRAYGLLEKYIPGKEITVGILEIKNKNMALPILELKPKKLFYDFEAKYTQGLTEFIIPAKLSRKETSICQTLAIKTHECLRCKGLSRVDMIFDPKTGPTILEINTIPGMTDLSDLPAQAKKHGLSYNELVETILVSAISRS